MCACKYACTNIDKTLILQEGCLKDSRGRLNRPKNPDDLKKRVDSW